MTGAGFAALVDLVDRGVIRILDLEFVTCRADGSVEGIQLQDLDTDGQFDLTIFEGVSSGLLDQSDFDDAVEGAPAGLVGRDLDLRESMGDHVRAGDAPGWRRVGGGRLHPARGRRRLARRDRRRLIFQEPHGEDEDMPGLLRGVARTAVVAGTATAVSNRVSRRQANRWSQQNEAQLYEQQQQYYQPPPPQYTPPPQPQYAQPAARSGRGA